MSLLKNGLNLPDNVFKVRVPIIATYTEQEIEIYGIPLDVNNTNGRPDKESYQNMTIAMLNLDRIIDIYIQGYPIYLVDQSQRELMFNILEEYIYVNNNDVRTSLNQNVVKDERLYEIDKFVNEMFNNNKESIVKEVVNQNNGYAINMGLMPTPGTIVQQPMHLTEEDNNGKPFNITDAYSRNKEPQPMQGGVYNPNVYNPNVYNPMFNNEINIDINKVTRKTTVKPDVGSNINASYISGDNNDY